MRFRSSAVANAAEAAKIMEHGGIGAMLYTIVFVTRNSHDISVADATTARDALAIIEDVQNRNGKIKFIKSPQEGEFGVELLRLLAKEEEEEIRISPD